MANNCADCGTNEPLVTIDPDLCEQNLYQIPRLAVVKFGGVEFDTVAPANNHPVAKIAGLSPDDQTAWDILTTIAPADPDEDSKVVFLPMFGGAPAVEAGAETSFGGGNETIGGAIQHTGFENSTFSARFDGLTALKEYQLNKLICEGSQMEVFPISFDDKIWGKRDGDIFKGIKPDTTLVTLGRNIPGREAKDNNIFNFQLKQNWSHTIESVTPTNFSPLNY